MFSAARRLVTALLVLVIPALTVTGACGADNGPFSEFTSDITRLVRTASPHLVQVMRGSSGGADDTEQIPTRMIGTGIAIGGANVLTSSGVVGPAAEVTVVSALGDTLTARVVGVDRRTNVAVLEVPGFRADALPTPRDGILFPGSVVVAVGLGPPDGPKASFGTVVLTDGPNMGLTEVDMVQFTAPAFPGITGGVLLNQEGEMVGMVSGRMSIDSGQAILPPGTDMISGCYQNGRLTTTAASRATLALPIRIATEVAGELIEKGSVERGYLGVQVALVHISTRKSTPFPGVMIHDLISGGPADKAGLIPTDVILRYAHARVTSPDDLSSLVAATIPGSTIPVLYLRRGTRSLATVVIEQAPDLPWKPEMDALISVNQTEADLAPLAH
jgi:S1-C subfamily serine protease